MSFQSVEVAERCMQVGQFGMRGQSVLENCPGIAEHCLVARVLKSKHERIRERHPWLDGRRIRAIACWKNLMAVS